MGTRFFAFGIVATSLVIAACSGDDSSPLPSIEDVLAPTPIETIPMEPLPETLPEPVILRGDGVEVEEEARDEIIYVVQPGDSLAAIAITFGIDSTELQRINGIVNPSVLRAGDELRVPVVDGGEADRIRATLDDEGQEIEEVGPPPGEEYTIQPGDTLSDIGVRFGISYLDIQSYNRLSDFEAGNLSVGATIIIPPPPEETAEEQEPTEPPG
ncbi:MAG TPA: LysM peptidoglycan-binding domain-containing protein [Dehalococcoidia bacterium]|nr:LysM peptidoglycan-binding domain-containing protein [Dehalococcoidia bacterium]